MICSISGEAPEEPVVSTKSGYIFEKRVIEKYISANGKDPVTDAPLSNSDLLPIKVNKAIKPRPLTATSIPGLLTIFQNEWDALMLETFSLKQQLDSVRQELSHALYQHDAACRVIARLIKERDEAKTALVNFQATAAIKPQAQAHEAMDVEAPEGITEEIKNKMQTKSVELSKGRKKRAISPTLATIEDLKLLQNTSSHPIHKSTTPGILTLDIHPNQQLLLTGGADKSAIIFNRTAKKIVSTLTGHTKKVTDVLFHPTEEVILTCSADHTSKIWRKGESETEYTLVHTLSKHGDEVSGLAIHPAGDYFVSGSLDSEWTFNDIRTGTCLTSAKAESPIHSIEIHPDGLLLGTGVKDDVVKVWDVKVQKSVATFEGHRGAVVSLAFSENGYYLATAATDDTIKLWDLRKLKNFHTIELPNKFGVSAVAWDYSGSYLAASGSDIRIYVGKSLNHAVTLAGHTAKVTDVKWGADAQFLASTSMDRSLKLWGKKE